jgi:hypothetical protein
MASDCAVGATCAAGWAKHAFLVSFHEDLRGALSELREYSVLYLIAITRESACAKQRLLHIALAPSPADAMRREGVQRYRAVIGDAPEIPWLNSLW